jgi:hypothetical protein
MVHCYGTTKEEDGQWKRDTGCSREEEASAMKKEKFKMETWIHAGAQCYGPLWTIMETAPMKL